MTTNDRKRKLNVIWFLVDSVRNYHCDIDDRGKLDIMDKFAQESIEFTKVVVSAPSTLMSETAMMTGMPSYYISRNYDDFKYDETAFTSLVEILRQDGYHDSSIIFFREGREKLQNLFHHVERRYWPKGLTHRKKAWTNDDINTVLSIFLEKGFQEPAFLFVNYNCRWDPETSRKVEHGLNMIKEKGLYKNSIIILCSDHGYPDPSRGITPEALKRRNLTHDLILTDDNILIPLYIKYPECFVTRIDTTISSLDIMPTILELLDSPVDTKIQGHSLLPLIRGENTNNFENIKVRVDARLMAQTGRATAIRGRRFKYIVYHDRTGDDREEFYDLPQDPFEEHNLAPTASKEVQAKLEEFRAEFAKQERDAVEFQFQYIFSRFQDSAKSLFGSDGTSQAKEILIFGSCQPTYLELLIKSIEMLSPQCHIGILLEEEVPENLYQSKYQIIDNRSKKLARKEFSQKYPDVWNHRYDLVVLPVDNVAGKGYTEIFKIARKLKKQRLIVVDYNMNVYYKRTRKWWFPLRVLAAKKHFYVQEPLLIFVDFYNNFIRPIKRRFVARYYGKADKKV